MTFSIEMPDSDSPAMNDFQSFMDKLQESQEEYIETIAKELGVSAAAAGDIAYLRTRSRWTQEKEDTLIALAKEGEPLPNVMAGEI